MADKLDTLPVDSTPLNHNEISLVNNLFQKENYPVIDKIVYGLKDVLIASLVFFFISLPLIDEGVKKVFPSTANSVYMMALIKTMVFGVVFFVINNISLAKASK